ncbi:MAG: hypothetical protein RL557_691 [archaeon]
MDTRNELFKRQEVSFTVESEKNPTYDEMKTVISEKFSKPEGQVHILQVLGHFGKNTFLVNAHVYDHLKDLESIQKLGKTRKKKKEEAKQEIEEKKKMEEEKKKAAEAAKSTVSENQSAA